MAINSSNSNTISILDLPQTQELVDGDRIVVQTDNGFQAIDFANFNAVKTDARGNATVVGNLSGQNAVFSNITSNSAVMSLYYYANNVKGVYAPQNYYNNFTINGGIVTSAAYVIGSPEYTNLTTSYLPTLTTFQNNLYKFIVDISSADSGQSLINFAAGTISQTYYIGGFSNAYPNINAGDIQPFHFTLSPIYAISAVPFVTSVTNTDTLGLKFTVNLSSPAKFDLQLAWRLLYTYSPTS